MYGESAWFAKVKQSLELIWILKLSILSCLCTELKISQYIDNDLNENTIKYQQA